MPTSIYFLTNRWYGLARMRRTQERVNKRYYAHRSDPYPNDTIIYYPGVPRGDIRAIERHQHPCAPGWNLRLACCGSRMMKLVRKSDANPPMVAAARDTLVRLIREQGLGGDGEQQQQQPPQPQQQPQPQLQPVPQPQPQQHQQQRCPGSNITVSEGEWTRFRHGLGMKPDLTFHSTVDDSWGVILVQSLPLAGSQWMPTMLDDEAYAWVSATDERCKAVVTISHCPVDFFSVVVWGRDVEGKPVRTGAVLFQTPPPPTQGMRMRDVQECFWFSGREGDELCIPLTEDEEVRLSRHDLLDLVRYHGPPYLGD